MNWVQSATETTRNFFAGFGHASQPKDLARQMDQVSHDEAKLLLQSHAQSVFEECFETIGLTPKPLSQEDWGSSEEGDPGTERKVLYKDKAPLHIGAEIVPSLIGTTTLSVERHEGTLLHTFNIDIVDAEAASKVEKNNGAIKALSFTRFYRNGKLAHSVTIQTQNNDAETPTTTIILADTDGGKVNISNPLSSGPDKGTLVLIPPAIKYARLAEAYKVAPWKLGILALNSLQGKGSELKTSSEIKKTILEMSGIGEFRFALCDNFLNLSMFYGETGSRQRFNPLNAAALIEKSLDQYGLNSLLPMIVDQGRFQTSDAAYLESLEHPTFDKDRPRRFDENSPLFKWLQEHRSQENVWSPGEIANLPKDEVLSGLRKTIPLKDGSLLTLGVSTIVNGEDKMVRNVLALTHLRDGLKHTFISVSSPDGVVYYLSSPEQTRAAIAEQARQITEVQDQPNKLPPRFTYEEVPHNPIVAQSDPDQAEAEFFAPLRASIAA